MLVFTKIADGSQDLLTTVFDFLLFDFN